MALTKHAASRISSPEILATSRDRGARDTGMDMLYAVSRLGSVLRLDGCHKDADTATLADFLCSDLPIEKIKAALEALPVPLVQDLCTTILPGGHTLVHMLAQRHKVAALRAVLDRGVDVNARNGQGCTPLFMALYYNALYSAKVLLEHGANPKEAATRRKGSSLLHMMVTCDRPRAVLLLLEQGADPNARDHEGKMPLHLAATLDNLPICSVLVRHQQCDVNALDADGKTALMLAVLNNNQQLARSMVEVPRVDLSLRDKDGMTCLHLAVSLGQVEVVRSLLKRNTIGINSKERRMGRTPLHFVCALVCDADGRGQSQSERLEADPAAKTPEKQKQSATCQEINSSGDVHSLTYEFVAMTTRPEESVNEVMECFSSCAEDRETSGHGYEMACRRSSPYEDTETASQRSSSSNITPYEETEMAFQRSRHATIHWYEDTEMVSQRCSRATINSSRNYEKGPVPLKGALKGKVVKGVLKTQTKEQAALAAKTPKVHKEIKELRQTIKSEHESGVLKIKRHAAKAKEVYVHTSGKTKSSRPSTAPPKLNQKTSSKSIPSIPNITLPFKGRPHSVTTIKEALGTQSNLTVAHFNVSHIRCRIVSMLLEHGADPNLMTIFRKSPLHLTAILGDANVLALLLPHAKNPNMLSSSNKTALHFAVEGGFVPIVGQLIEAGANLTLRDIQGMTALHHAASLGLVVIAKMLLRAGADPNSNDFQQRTPLHHACIRNHSSLISILIDAGASEYKNDVAGLQPKDYQKGSWNQKKGKVQVAEKPDEKPSPILQQAPSVDQDIKQLPTRKNMDYYLRKLKRETHPLDIDLSDDDDDKKKPHEAVDSLLQIETADQLWQYFLGASEVDDEEDEPFDAFKLKN